MLSLKKKLSFVLRLWSTIRAPISSPKVLEVWPWDCINSSIFASIILIWFRRRATSLSLASRIKVRWLLDKLPRARPELFRVSQRSCHHIFCLLRLEFPWDSSSWHCPYIIWYKNLSNKNSSQWNLLISNSQPCWRAPQTLGLWMFRASLCVSTKINCGLAFAFKDKVILR